MKSSNLNTILLVIGIGLLLFFKFCGNTPEPTDTGKGKLVSSDTSRSVDTNTYHTETKNFNFHQTDTVKFVPILDSLTLRAEFEKLFKDYFTKYFYTDTTIKGDMQVIINDTVTKNSISHRDVWLKNLKPTTTITNTYEKPEPPKTKVFLGAVVDYHQRDSSGISAGITLDLLNKKENLYKFKYDPFYKTYEVGYAVKLKFKFW